MSKPITVYVPLSVEEELIPVGKKVSVSMDNGITFPYEAVGKNWGVSEIGYTHWLKEQIAYVHTPEELLELKKKWCSEAFDAGYKRGCSIFFGEPHLNPEEKETYVNNLTIE